MFPWADSSIEGVQAWHVLEHLGPGTEPLFHCLREVYRVCENGASFGIILPHPRHDVFINDVTHMRAITPQGMAMFGRKYIEDNKAKGVVFTPMYAYIGVDFELQPSIKMVVDPRIPDGSDLAALERSENNVIIEYHFTMRVRK